MRKEALSETAKYSGIISSSRVRSETDATRKGHSVLGILIERLKIKVEKRTDPKKEETSVLTEY